MLSIDDRTGSGELVPYFTPYGIKVLKTRLEYGDLAWVGNGPRGEVAVCIERKRIEDLIQSMQSRRLSGHQLPGMAHSYDYCYLIVEGYWSVDEHGRVMVNKQPVNLHYRALDSYLSTLENRAGLIYRRTMTMRETIECIVSLYRWWTEKEWLDHVAHEAVYAPASNSVIGRRMLLSPREVSCTEKITMQLPGLDRSAQQVAKRLKSVADMVRMSHSDWSEFKIRDKKGTFKRVGSSRAKKIWEALHGG